MNLEVIRTVVFISGSRTIDHIDEKVQNRIQSITGQEFEIIIGDAEGADRAVQEYLAKINYRRVTIFCSGYSYRNNLGNWNTMYIHATGLTGREFYTQKDKRMAEEAEYGFVIWDGTSPGSLNNIRELLERNKRVLVYHEPKKRFYSVSDMKKIKKIEEEAVLTI